jgi:hypothetical protein
MEVLLSAVEGRVLTLAPAGKRPRREGHGADETDSALSGIRRLVD